MKSENQNPLINSELNECSVARTNVESLPRFTGLAALIIAEPSFLQL